ncbi:MAG: histidine phosphatase family protein [Clostridia bacterium]|nr:histidine phosphatase family protein [Clostridia bacterium]
MVTFIIVRHGFSLGNKEKRFSGQLDTPLDEIGLSQADSIAKYVIKRFKIDSIYSSDLSRAYDTVKQIGEKLSIDIKKCTALREIDVGKWQGKLIEEVRNEFPESFEQYKQTPGCFKFDGGESYEELMIRVKHAFDEIAEENEGKTVLVGVHGGVIRSLRAAWNNIPIEKIKDIPHVPNASISIAEYDKGNINWIEIGYADHLENKTTEEGVR